MRVVLNFQNAGCSTQKRVINFFFKNAAVAALCFTFIRTVFFFVFGFLAATLERN